VKVEVEVDRRVAKSLASSSKRWRFGSLAFELPGASSTYLGGWRSRLKLSWRVEVEVEVEAEVRLVGGLKSGASAFSTPFLLLTYLSSIALP
jgi:hypothetical protein